MDTIAVVPVCWAGLDVAKASFDAAFIPADFDAGHNGAKLRTLKVRQFARTQAGAREFVAWARAQQTPAQPWRVVLEATGTYSTQLAQWLRTEEPAVAPAIVNPKLTADFIKSLGIRNKTDRIEARALALFGLERTPAPEKPPSKTRAALRALCRYRDALVQQRTAEGLRAEEAHASAAVFKLQSRRLAQLDKDIARVEKEMKAVVRKDAPLQHDLGLLLSIYGVGFLTAAAVLAEAGDLRRFARARQLAAFAGLSPRQVQSGTSVNTSHLCRQGNARLRRALYMAAVTTVRGDNELAAFYARLCENGKPHKQALTAVMRKLLLLMRALLVTNKPFQAHPKDGGKSSEQTVENPTE